MAKLATLLSLREIRRVRYYNNIGVRMLIPQRSEIEGEIEKLEGLAEPSAADKQRLKELKAELEKINKKKEEYVEEHPEARNLVYRRKKHQDGDQPEEQVAPAKRNVFNKHGMPRHPERSIYYDPVYNPYGVPPPGMPYAERRETVFTRITSA